jgi:acyl-CoA thioesterase-1
MAGKKARRSVIAQMYGRFKLTMERPGLPRGMMAFLAAAVATIATIAALGGGLVEAATRPVTLVVLGDSLSAGLGLKMSEAFPAQLQRALAAAGYSVTVINGGVSGDTANDGLARLDWSVGPEADAVILEFGANDALRGIDPAVTRRALDAMLARLTDRHLPVLVAGMLAPPNMGDAYASAFNRIFPELAMRYGVALYPFFLDGVVTDARLEQSDALHPNAAGAAVIVKRMLPAVEALVQQIDRR